MYDATLIDATAVELSFRRIVFQRRDFPGKSREPGRKYRRVIAYDRAIIRVAPVRIYPAVILPRVRDDEEDNDKAEGTRRRRRRRAISVLK